MAKRPYIFTRYSIWAGDEALGSRAQFNMIEENQGVEFDHVTRGTGGDKSTLIMEPREFTVFKSPAMSFRVGVRRYITQVEDYDRVSQKRTRSLESIKNIEHAHFIIIPGSGIMAVEDRSGEFSIRASTALNAFKRIVSEVIEDGHLDIQSVQSDDVAHALKSWDIKEYTYTARPLNPIDHTALAKARTDLYKLENVQRDSAKLFPAEGQSLEMNGGIIQATHELSEVGYAQTGVKGYTEEGQFAQIPKPKFHDTRQKNLEERDKQRFIRVFVECDDDQDELFSGEVARALRGFYDGRA